MKFFIKALKSMLLSAILFSLTILFVLTVNYDLRREVFTWTVHMFLLHEESVVRTLVQQERYAELSDRIMRNINLSTKISKGRSFVFEEVLHHTEFAAERATQKELTVALKPVFERLLEIEPDLYRTRIWLAEATGDSNYQDAILNIDKAIELSEVDEQAYRVAIKIAKNNKDQLLAQLYCNKYAKAQSGGLSPELFYTGYPGAGLRELSVKFNENERQVYSNSGLKLGEYRNYEFIPKKPFDFEELKLSLNVVPGTEIKIDNISFFTENGQRVIEAQNFMTTTKSAYDISNNLNSDLVLVSMGSNTEIIHMRSVKIIEGIKKITIKMMFSRLPIAGRSVCQ